MLGILKDSQLYAATIISIGLHTIVSGPAFVRLMGSTPSRSIEKTVGLSERTATKPNPDTSSPNSVANSLNPAKNAKVKIEAEDYTRY